MQKLHVYVQTNGDAKVKVAYQNTAEKSLEELNRVLTGLKKANFDSEQVQLLQTRFVNVVESVFEIFLPVQWQTPIASRYWGAAIQALTAIAPSKSRRYLFRSLDVLDKISNLGKQLRAQLSAGKGPDPTQTEVPRGFVRAWYHSLLCVLYWSPLDMELAYKQARTSYNLLISSRRKILKRQDGGSLRDLEVILPTGLLLFMIRSLLNDVTEQFPNIKDAYCEYYDELEVAFKANPLDRTLQKKISFFIDEITILQHRIDSQARVLRNLSELFRLDEY